MKHSSAQAVQHNITIELASDPAISLPQKLTQEPSNIVLPDAIFLCYPKCSTCMKAKHQLDEGKVSYRMRDIKLDRPTSSELKQWIDLSGLPIQKFFNTSGLIYKEKNLKQVLPTLSDEEKIELLASDGMLVKRPILILGNQVLVGYNAESYAALGC